MACSSKSRFEDLTSRWTTPAGVRVLEALGDLAADVRRLRRGEPAAGVEQGPQRAAREELEHHERHAGVLAPVVDGDDVGMVQRGGELGLGPEPAQEPGVLGEGPVEHLDRDAPAQPDVVGHVHAAARACTDRGEQAVAAGEDAADEVGDAGQGHPSTVPERPHHDGQASQPRASPRRHRRPVAARYGSAVATTSDPEPSPRPDRPGGQPAPPLFSTPGAIAIVVGSLVVVAEPRVPAAERVGHVAERSHLPERDRRPDARAGRDHPASGHDRRRPARRPDRCARAARTGLRGDPRGPARARRAARPGQLPPRPGQGHPSGSRPAVHTPSVLYWQQGKPRPAQPGASGGASASGPELASRDLRAPRRRGRRRP